MAVTIGLPSLILLVGLVDDLKSRKIHNWLIVGLLSLTVLAVGIAFGIAGLQQGLLGLCAGVALCLPLFMGRILGGGDLKLLAVFGMASDWNSVLWVLAYSFFWGALLGLIRAILGGTALELIRNTVQLVLPKSQDKDFHFHRIPYSVALVFGWLTHLSLMWR